MEIASWNVNGLRARINSGYLQQYIKDYSPDILAIQETKLQEDNLQELKWEEEFDDYEMYFNHAKRPGYSGTAIFTKVEPLDVTYGIEMDNHDTEGRVITMEFDKFFLVNVYTPNSGRGLPDLDYRMEWEKDFREYLNRLDVQKPVILCGDLNVAHTEKDIKNPDTNRRSAGFTDEERNKFTELLNTGFVDSFRHFNPDVEDAYTWWAYWRNARERNVGWRLDYFVVSDKIMERVNNAKIHSEVMGSDHCPVSIDLEV